jgi:hypothetical protein
MVRLTQRARKQETRSKNGGAQRVCSPPDRERRAPPCDTYEPRRRSALRSVAERAAEPSGKGRPERHCSSEIPAREHPFTRKIIGRTLHRRALAHRAAKLACVSRAHLPVLDQPSRQLGRGGLLHPLIQQTLNVRAQICGAIEPRKLKALQRKRARRQQEFPGRLGRGRVHECLLESRGDNTGLVILVKLNREVRRCA